MLDWLHKYGLPQNLSIQGEYIDNANVLMHWLMLFLFIGWGVFFIIVVGLTAVTPGEGGLRICNKCEHTGGGGLKIGQNCERNLWMAP